MLAILKVRPLLWVRLRVRVIEFQSTVSLSALLLHKHPTVFEVLQDFTKLGLRVMIGSTRLRSQILPNFLAKKILNPFVVIERVIGQTRVAASTVAASVFGSPFITQRFRATYVVGTLRNIIAVAILAAIFCPLSN